jgi:hypothetical protein
MSSVIGQGIDGAPTNRLVSYKVMILKEMPSNQLLLNEKSGEIKKV